MLEQSIHKRSSLKLTIQAQETTFPGLFSKKLQIGWQGAVFLRFFFALDQFRLCYIGYWVALQGKDITGIGNVKN